MEHECKYEYRWGEHTQSIQNIEKAVDDIKKCTREIKDSVNTTVTQNALNKQSINRIWWWVGGISLSIMAIAFFVIRSAIAQ
jgi:uncharacterized protein YoxC